MRYQHAVADRDVAIAKALSGLAEASRAANPAGYSRDETHDPDDDASNVVPLNSDNNRAADRDRTGIISLEDRQSYFAELALSKEPLAAGTGVRP